MVEERFCSRCGQENTEPKENFAHLVGHFFSDITHFDAQIFTTLKDLIFRPGFLTREYIAGKRARYLHPVRMYVFISAVFFLAIFAGSEEGPLREENSQHSTNLFRQQLADSLRAVVKATRPLGKADSIRTTINGEMASLLDSTEALAPNDESIYLSAGSGGKVIMNLTENKYRNLRDYDSTQRTLPDSAKEKGIMKWVLRNNIRLKEQHDNRSHIRLEVDFQHTIPRIMFVLLPVFALFTRWFYSRKKYFYVQHAIFSVHFHSFVFLLFLLFLLLGKIIPGEWTGLILAGISLLLVFVYLVAALHGMYGQSFWLSLFKAFVISLLYVLSIILAMGLVVVFSFLWA